MVRRNHTDRVVLEWLCAVAHRILLQLGIGDLALGFQ